MIQDENFLVFGDEWGFYPTTTGHVLRRLAKQNKFLWVNMFGMRAPELNLHDLRRASQKIWQWVAAKPSRRSSNGVALYSPVILPFGKSPLARWWNCRAVAKGVRRRLRELPLRDPVFFTSLPTAADMVGLFEEKLVVYLCEDEYAEMPGVYRDYIRETEQKLIERADLVFVTSKALVKPKSKPSSAAVFLPQGVDFEHFNLPGGDSVSVPPELAAIPRPRLGFAGLLAPWVDLDLLVAVARAYPRVSIVLVGQVRTDIDSLRHERNIFVLGPRPYAELPRYLAEFDVGLIPFQVNELTRYVNPLKLLEYFASGLPVVSTVLPDIETYGDVVYCAQSRDEFVALVGEAVVERSAERRERRTRFAKANSWEQRAEELSDHVEAALEKRKLCGWEKAGEAVVGS